MVESTPNSDYPRIALILNRYQAVINKGAKDGVRMGQSFLIYSIGPEVEDPVTKKNLGPIEYVKGRGRVIHVQDNVATIRSSEEKPVYSPTPPNPISFGLGRPQPIRYEEQPFRDIEVGDYARPV